MGKVTAVIGGQYGSEGKGTVVRKIADQYGVHVRVGSHNAGHSFKDDQGKIWKMQQVPVGWINPKAVLIIGRGALISPKTLLREMNEIAEVDPRIWNRVMVDAGAGILDEHHHEAEGGVKGGIHTRIGSTGEGVGAARIARLQRDPTKFRHFRDLVRDPNWRHLERLVHEDTPRFLNSSIQNGVSVLLEGSQGVGLSITHGPWPFVTTTDCGAAQLAADVGIPPTRITDILCVLRTYPIRVAGNSGTMKHEITWEELSARLGRPVQEKTTVTHKVRRIGGWDWEQIDLAVTLNAPTAFALNFVDYLDSKDEGVSNFMKLSTPSRLFIDTLERRYGIPVAFVGTGGKDWTVIDRGL